MQTLNKDEEANKLAQKHYEVEAGLTRILRITENGDVGFDPNEPIKLLEVNKNTVPSGIMPIGFGAVPEAGFHFPSVIVEVTPEEFTKIENHELDLPEGWELGPDIPRLVESTEK